MTARYLIVRGDDFGMCHGANRIWYYTQPAEGRIEHVKKRLLEEGPDLRMMLAHPGTHSDEMAALREFLDEKEIRLVGLKEMVEKKERESP